jgi:hypothetical protein
MTSITVQDGQIVLRDGAIGTEQACCCKKCEGPCEENEDCAPGCVCVDGECVEGKDCDCACNCEVTVSIAGQTVRKLGDGGAVVYPECGSLGLVYTYGICKDAQDFGNGWDWHLTYAYYQISCTSGVWKVTVSQGATFINEACTNGTGGPEITSDYQWTGLCDSDGCPQGDPLLAGTGISGDGGFFDPLLELECMAAIPEISISCNPLP